MTYIGPKTTKAKREGDCSCRQPIRPGDAVRKVYGRGQRNTHVHASCAERGLSLGYMREVA